MILAKSPVVFHHCPDFMRTRRATYYVLRKGRGMCLARCWHVRVRARTLYFMQRGRAQIMNMLPGGGQASVGDLGPGSVLGEMARLDSGVPFSNVEAREP